nr:threonine--tRNA ligase, mitochondrial 1-like [Tanacetum cinerariifolium]
MFRGGGGFVCSCASVSGSGSYGGGLSGDWWCYRVIKDKGPITCLHVLYFQEKQAFERIEVSRKQALDIFSDNKFKVELINHLPEDEPITVYRCGPLVDLCRGPHIPKTSFVKAFECLKASAAYWKGEKECESLQRVYGISYPNQKRLKAVSLPMASSNDISFSTMLACLLLIIRTEKVYDFLAFLFDRRIKFLLVSVPCLYRTYEVSLACLLRIKIDSDFLLLNL